MTKYIFRPAGGFENKDVPLLFLETTDYGITFTQGQSNPTTYRGTAYLESPQFDNSTEALYIKGSENEDGSLRIIPDTSAGTEAEFQLRSNGVWNDTGILIAASTVYLGRELQISAGGEWMLTKDESADIRSLIPHVRFDIASGTDETVVVPVVGALNPNVILQPDDSGEITAQTIQWTGTATDLVLANALDLRTGAQPATDTVTVNLYRTDFGSGLFYRRSYPASDFPANSDIRLITDGLVELLPDEIFYLELTTTTDNAFSLKADATNTTPYWGGDFYFVTEDTITPDQVGGSSRYQTYDNNGFAVCDNSGISVLGYGNNTELEPPVSAIGSAFNGAVSFSEDANTDKLAVVPAGVYRYTGTTGATLTLDNNTKQFAREANVWVFTIKDEGGNCTAAPLTITPESGTIDGAASIQLIIDYGSVVIYSNGTNFWSM